MSRKAAGPPTLSIWWMLAWDKYLWKPKFLKSTWFGSRTQQGSSGLMFTAGSIFSARNNSPSHLNDNNLTDHQHLSSTYHIWASLVSWMTLSSCPADLWEVKWLATWCRRWSWGCQRGTWWSRACPDDRARECAPLPWKCKPSWWTDLFAKRNERRLGYLITKIPIEMSSVSVTWM